MAAIVMMVGIWMVAGVFRLGRIATALVVMMVMMVMRMCVGTIVVAVMGSRVHHA